MVDKVLLKSLSLSSKLIIFKVTSLNKQESKRKRTKEEQMDANIDVYNEEAGFDLESIVLRRADPDDCD